MDGGGEIQGVYATEELANEKLKGLQSNSKVWLYFSYEIMEYEIHENNI